MFLSSYCTGTTAGDGVIGGSAGMLLAVNNPDA
jgi:hypothetical protein